ncbi:MAG: Mrp/NBP35 family ATP-binding protein [candidate division Zixibacteria bacterium]|nr:Mrp/NBP35 family ATP-binding protein [candidate division Zixibacteria bacterium]
MSKNTIDDNTILEALQSVNDPEIGRSIVDLGMVNKINRKNGTVKIEIKLTIMGCPLKHRFEEDVTAALMPLEGVDKVELSFIAMKPQERANLTKKMTGRATSEMFDKTKAKHVIGIASGKGGVGKSTVTVNLAYALKDAGYRVGIIDADVYGFSVPRMMGASELPTVIDDAMIPVTKDDIKIMSMGFFINEDQAVLWRGPMLHKTVVQFLTQVYWDNLDFLLIDLPPGTGDITLSIAQTVPDAHMLVVTTPQPAASGVAQRVAELSKKANFKLLGVVENMSYFTAPDGSRQNIFGEGGGRLLSTKLDQPLFGQIPLETKVREGGDMGQPISSNGDSEAAKSFKEITEKILEKLKNNK